MDGERFSDFFRILLRSRTTYFGIPSALAPVSRADRDLGLPHTPSKHRSTTRLMEEFVEEEVVSSLFARVWNSESFEQGVVWW